MAAGGMVPAATLLLLSAILPLLASAFIIDIPVPHLPLLPIPNNPNDFFRFPWEKNHGGGRSNDPPATEQGGLREGFYNPRCPEAENIVNDTIHKIFRRDPTIAPALVRLFFHDCFVTGCDASILLDETPTGDEVEKKARHNGKFVRGFEAIDEIKTELEAQCPGVVSCSDILAFSARDSLVFTGVPHYKVASGRRDSMASLARNCIGNLPLPDTPIDKMIFIFKKKGFSLEDLVVLTGAHSIGNAHCSIVADRFHDQEKSKEIDFGYMIKMQTLTQCQVDTQDIPFDPYSSYKMDSRYYKELLDRKALLESDHNLAKEPNGRDIMEKLVGDQKGWLEKFTDAMIKLGHVEVLTGDQGQIRRQCRAVM